MSFKPKTDKKESENKNVRFPLTLIKRIEDVLKCYDITFSGFVLQACEYALDNMLSNQDDSPEDKNKEITTT